MIEDSRPINARAAMRERQAQQRLRLEQAAERRSELQQQQQRQRLARLEIGSHPSDRAALADARGQLHERPKLLLPEWCRPDSGEAARRSKWRSNDYFGLHASSGSQSDRGPSGGSGMGRFGRLPQLQGSHKSRSVKLAGMLAHML